MGPGILPETTVGKHNLQCNLQMPTKVLSCKKEAICEHGQKCHHVLWAKDHLKWTVSKWKSVLWSDESKFNILDGNHGCHFLRAKKEGDLPVCYQHSVQKPASLIVCGCLIGVSKLISLSQCRHGRFIGIRACHASIKNAVSILKSELSLFPPIARVFAREMHGGLHCTEYALWETCTLLVLPLAVILVFFFSFHFCCLECSTK